jgi:beta-galactosidase
MLSKWLCFLIFVSLAISSCVASAQQPAPHSFGVQNGQFVLDGKPFRIISGEMHYLRIPRAYWQDRFRMARAMGLNTVTTYVFWNAHEPRPGLYDFSGNNDIAEFIREAQQEGLYVILRPGPYVCAEWEFGGFPAWLLKDHSVILRSRDSKFLQQAARWIKRLGEELAPLQIGSGGPILLVQVENEYGSFGDDHAYMEQIRRMLVDAGFTKSQFYTADAPENIAAGSLPDLPVGINFGSSAGQAQKSFAILKKIRPNGPFLNSEFWDGWFDHWGGKHATTNLATEAADLDWMLRQGYSVNLYMFHGGTSFGWMNGANGAAMDGENYEPDVTSYDYNAPLDESGRPTLKYFTFRNIIAEATGTTPPAVPAVVPTGKLPEFKLEEAVSLWSVLPPPVHSEQIQSMEDLDQAYGYILYRKRLKGPAEGDLVLDELHDYAQVYLDGKLVGALDRRLAQTHLWLNVPAASARLDILVENTGRINFNVILRGERKGITKQVTLAGEPLLGWDIYSLPMTEPSKLPFAHTSCEGPCFYRATVHVDAPADTFLDTSAFAKGVVWLNGLPLGRIWSIGPQKTLYVPAPWLHRGEDEIVIFDVNGRPRRMLLGRDNAILFLPGNIGSAWPDNCSGP